MLSESMTRRRVALLAWCLCLCVHGGGVVDAAAQAPAAAPSETGTISGVATDEIGAAVSDVRITVTNDTTALRRETVTGAEGTFTVPLLPPGPYTLRAEREGFSALEISGIVLRGGDPVVLRVELKVASLSEAVVVTARKREERLQDVPASIAAASGQTLSALNIVSLTELDAVAPGLTFVTNPSRFGSGPSIALRGISTQTQGSGVQDSVGIVIDGVVIERAKAGAFPDLSDTARVEVLRGPQGTLFGKNASAGVISITTKDPTHAFAADAGLEYGTYDTRTMRASLSGPMGGHRLLGRLSAYSKTRDGFVENIFDGSQWERDDQKGVRGKLLFTPTFRDTFKVSMDFVEQKNDGGTNIIRGFTPATPPYVVDALGSIAGPTNDKINSRSQGRNYQRSRGAALQWDRVIGQHALTALAAVRTYDQDFHAGTYTWLTPLNEGDQFGYTNQDQYSAELRVASPARGRLDYVAGLFVLDNKTGIGLADPSTALVGTPNRVARNQVSKVTTFNYASFAEANVRVTDRLGLTGGVRWTHETVEMTVVGYPIAPGLIRSGHPLGVTSDSDTVDNASWRLGGQWRLDQDRMFYASVATGYKGPGFNVNTSVLGDSQHVEPETSTSYEAGMKSQFADRKVTLNLNVYRSRFEDFQTQGGIFPNGPNLPGQIVLLNAEALVTRGFEAEITAAARESTELSLRTSYIDGTFERFTNAPCYPGQAVTAPGTCAGNVQDLSGTRLPNTPKWTVNLFARQMFDMPAAAWRGFATADYSWRSSIQWNILGSPNGIEPGYGLLGASLGLRRADDRLGIKIYGKNLTDRFHTSGIVVSDAVTHFLPPDYRRVIGIETTVKF
jgi:iron complex outermembrane receptor protein